MTAPRHLAAGAANAASARLGETDFDRYVVIEDTDDDAFVIRTLVRERSPRHLMPDL